MSLFVYPRASAYGLNIKPSEGSELYFYEAGTTTDKTVYTDPDLSIAHPQPVPAEANGVFPAIYLTGTYKVVLKDPNGVTESTDDDQIARAGSVQIKGDFDSATNGGNYPASGLLGDMYRVTATFTLAAASGGHQVVDGDFIIANKNGATAIDADWDIIRGTYPNRAVEALTAAASIATDCNLGTTFTVTLDQNSTLANPTNKLVGYTYTWIITNGTSTAYTLAFGTDYSFDGTSDIKSSAGSVTIIKGTVVSSSSIICVIEGGPQSVDSEAKNLQIDVESTTTVSMTCDRISYIDGSGHIVFGDFVGVTYDITTDKQGPELASHWYQLWIDSDETLKMVPDLTGTADANVLNSLSASAALFQTYSVSAGDEIYQTTDNTKGYVKAVSSETLLTIMDEDGNDLDLFPLGTEDFVIHMLSPVGLGEFKANIGAVYNTSGSDLRTANQIDNKVTLANATMYSGSGYTGSLQALDVSAFIPVTAKVLVGIGTPTDATPSPNQMLVASTSAGVGQVTIGNTSGATTINGYYELEILEKETIYQRNQATSIVNTIKGWRY